MRFKYYLRGAGVGILVTTIVLSIAFFRFKPTLTADEIRLQARKLGMVEAEEAEKQNTEKETNEKENTETNKKEDPEDPSKQTEDPKKDAEDTKEEAEKEKDTEKDSKKEDSTEKDSKKEDSAEKDSKKEDSEKESTAQKTEEKKDEEEPKKIRFVVSGGEFSDVICEHLKDKGLIKNAERYNRWLGRHGYDNKIQPGVYHIKEGSTYREIAEILSEH